MYSYAWGMTYKLHSILRITISNIPRQRITQGHGVLIIATVSALSSRLQPTSCAGVSSKSLLWAITMIHGNLYCHLSKPHGACPLVPLEYQSSLVSFASCFFCPSLLMRSRSTAPALNMGERQNTPAATRFCSSGSLSCVLVSMGPGQRI